MRPRRLRTSVPLWHLLCTALIVGVILVAGSSSFGTRGPAMEAAFSKAIPSMTRRIHLPIIQVSPAPPAPGVYLGAWVPGLPQNMSALDDFQKMVGTKMAIVTWYEGWNAQNVFNHSAAQTVADQGSMPLVTWEPWTSKPAHFDADIAGGKYDSFIRSYALGAKNYGKPVLLRFAHEMNGDYYPWAVGLNGNTRQDYINAWRRVHDIFTGVGATNVLWVWSPSVGSTIPLDQIHTVYPGDDYVDWIGIDGFNGGTALDWGGWLWFSDVFGAYYRELTKLSQKPVMIAETASVEQGGSKAAWITDAMLVQLPRDFPRIKAFIWFSENWYDQNGRNADWRIDSSSTSLSAFSQAAANSNFKSSWP